MSATETRASLLEAGRAMKEAYNERLRAGYEPVKERRDLLSAFQGLCTRAGLSRSAAKRLTKAVL